MSYVLGRPPSLWHRSVSEIVRKHFNFKTVDQNSVKTLPSYDDRNYYFRGEHLYRDGYEFVLKLNNPLRTSFEEMEALACVMKHLDSCNLKFSTPFPVTTKEGRNVIQLSSKELVVVTDEQLCSSPTGTCVDSSTMNNGDDSIVSNKSVGDVRGLSYPVSVQSFIPGCVFDSIDKTLLTSAMLFQVGEMIGIVDKELRDNYSSKTLESRCNYKWDLMHFLTSKKFLREIDDPDKRSKAEIIFKSFQENVSPKIPTFTKSIIHGDPNGLNIIVNKSLLGEDTYHLTGLIDFGDCCISSSIFDLGMCLAYMMLENLEPVTCSNVLEFVGPVISGYNSILPLSTDEFSVLYFLVLARSLQSAVMGEIGYKVEPWNTYLLSTPRKFWLLMDKLLNIPKEEVDTIWKKYI